MRAALRFNRTRNLPFRIHSKFIPALGRVIKEATLRSNQEEPK
jgi:hypothetical protein